MGIPFYHTDESALQTVKEYQELHDLPSLEDALRDMEHCIDDLDNEDRSAMRHVLRTLKEKHNGV